MIVAGGERRQYEVVLEPERLLAYELTVADVVRALEQTSINVSAGFVTEGGQEYLVHGIGRVRTPDDVGDTLVALRDGTPILVRQLGTVRVGAAIRRASGGLARDGRHGGRRAVDTSLRRRRAPSSSAQNRSSTGRA